VLDYLYKYWWPYTVWDLMFSQWWIWRLRIWVMVLHSLVDGYMALHPTRLILILYWYFLSFLWCFQFIISFRGQGMYLKYLYYNTDKVYRKFVSSFSHSHPIMLYQPNMSLPEAYPVLPTKYLYEGLSPSWEDNSCSATQEISSIVWEPKVYYCVHKSLPLMEYKLWRGMR
jgi:hypothetical protein